MMKRLVAALVLSLAALSCGGPADYGDGCGKSADCKSPMVCPTEGPMSGRCTKDCTKDEECASIGGGVCSSDVCNPK